MKNKKKKEDDLIRNFYKNDKEDSANTSEEDKINNN